MYQQTSVAAAFLALVGRRPDGVWSAPGRVNLIGEHTDYNDGVVLPLALQLRTTVAAGKREDSVLCVHSVQRPGDVVSAPIQGLAPDPGLGWAAYVAGVAWALWEAGHLAQGTDMVIDSDVPAGAGLASSAAMACAAALALADLHDLRLAPVDLARLAQRAENEFAGVPCGLMDQTVAMLATSGHALFFDTRSGATEQIAFDPAAAGLRLLVIDTHVRHSHAVGTYAERRRECAAGAALLGVPTLRDLTAERLDRAVGALSPLPALTRRVRHVVTENARTVRAADVLRAGRLGELGPLLSASHRSLRDDFEVSVPELDVVVDAAIRAGALGARMTGGGFGGCVIALVAAERAAAMIEAVVGESVAHDFPAPTAMPVTASVGARRHTGLDTAR